MGVGFASLAVLIVAGNLVLQVPLPKDPIGFAVAFLLGMSALFALGLLVAAVAPTPGIATAMFVPLFVLVMFLGGVYLPRMLLPEFLIRIGDYTPPGVQALLDAWSGTPPQPAQLAVMGLITILAGTAAARRFRWE
jgi:ABC-2 type transport system permease protein